MYPKHRGPVMFDGGQAHLGEHPSTVTPHPAQPLEHRAIHEPGLRQPVVETGRVHLGNTYGWPHPTGHTIHHNPVTTGWGGGKDTGGVPGPWPVLAGAGIHRHHPPHTTQSPVFHTHDVVLCG